MEKTKIAIEKFRTLSPKEMDFLCESIAKNFDNTLHGQMFKTTCFVVNKFNEELIGTNIGSFEVQDSEAHGEIFLHTISFYDIENAMYSIWVDIFPEGLPVIKLELVSNAFCEEKGDYTIRKELKSTEVPVDLEAVEYQEEFFEFVMMNIKEMIEVDYQKLKS